MYTLRILVKFFIRLLFIFLFPFCLYVLLQKSCVEESDSRSGLSLHDANFFESHSEDQSGHLIPDIEGAEYEIFKHGKKEWLSRVRLLSIEMHDKYVPGVTKMITDIIAESSSHDLRIRPFPCSEYYVWFSPEMYELESGSSTCSSYGYYG